MKPILAWHWSDGMKCQFDGSPIKVGKTLIYKGEEPIELCERGFHASTRILDALEYAPGTTISRVRLSGEIIRGSDKIVATHRTCLWAFDAKYILITFAADCAERALYRAGRLGLAADSPCFDAIEAARRFVKYPTKKNRSVAREVGDRVGGYIHNWLDLESVKVNHIHSASSAAGAASAAAGAVAAGWISNFSAYAARASARAAGAAIEKERKWQSAHLRHLIAAGRRHNSTYE